MSPLVLAMALAAVAGIGITLVIAGLRPSSPDLEAAVTRMRPETLLTRRPVDHDPAADAVHPNDHAPSPSPTATAARAGR